MYQMQRNWKIIYAKNKGHYDLLLNKDVMKL